MQLSHLGSIILTVKPFDLFFKLEYTPPAEPVAKFGPAKIDESAQIVVANKEKE